MKHTCWASESIVHLPPSSLFDGLNMSARFYQVQVPPWQNSLINPIIYKNAVYILGSIYPCGKLTRSPMQKANTNVESNSIRKQSHSIAAILQKNGRAKLSSRYRFLFIKRFSWQNPLIIAAPAIDSPKRWITGDFCMLRIRTSSLDDAM